MPQILCLMFMLVTMLPGPFHFDIRCVEQNTAALRGLASTFFCNRSHSPTLKALGQNTLTHTRSFLSQLYAAGPEPSMNFTCSTSALKLLGSLMARSASTFLFKLMFCCCSPCMNREYGSCKHSACLSNPNLQDVVLIGALR